MTYVVPTPVPKTIKRPNPKSKIARVEHSPLKPTIPTATGTRAALSVAFHPHWLSDHQHRGRDTEAPGVAQRDLYGPWLTDAKRYFSRENQATHLLSRDYVTAGEVDRQAMLEKAITWASGKGDDNIKAHMNDRRLEPNAHAFRTYFKSVIDWAKLTLPRARGTLRSVPWDVLYPPPGSCLRFSRRRRLARRSS